MADTYKTLAQGQLPSSVGTLYTAPSGSGAIVVKIFIVNNDSSARTFTLYIDGTANSNAIMKNVSVDAGGFVEITGPIAITASTGTIRGVGSVASQLTYTITGDEVS